MDLPVVLVIEPDDTWRRTLRGDVDSVGFDVDYCDAGDIDGIMRRKSSVSALILGPTLDLSTQIQICRLFRRLSFAPIIALSPRSDDAEELRMLSMGAAEFFTVPLRTPVFLARLTGRIRDFEHAYGKKIRAFGNVRLELDQRSVEVRGAAVDLTKTEFDILAVMSASPSRVFSRQELAEAIWDEEWHDNDHRIEAHMSRLRKKINEAGAEDLLVAIRGVGYRLLSAPPSTLPAPRT